MSPSRQLFGLKKLPRSHLVLLIGDEELIRTQRVANLSYGFQAKILRSQGVAAAEESTFWEDFWRYLSLHNLRPAEQQLVKFLLLLPLAGLIVSLFRTVIGVPTFGTFGPALM